MKSVSSSEIKKLTVGPGKKIKLEDYDPDSRGKQKSHKEAMSEIEKQLHKLDKLQYLMYSENKHSLLIILQGLDGAGKDGVIKHVLTGMNPQGCTVTSFKQPTPEELDHDFLWRIHPHVPAKRAVAIFNRSHYEDVLVARVHGLVSEKEWSERYDLINRFETLLVQENKTTILKFFLHISKDEQLTRFKKRLNDPTHNWKISEADYKERDFWEEYTEAYEVLLQETSTAVAPWYIVPSNHKWYRDLAISEIIVNSFENLGMQPPVATVNLAEIREKYHAILLKNKDRKKGNSGNRRP